MTEILDALEDVSSRYDALFCDLWGCLHDGLRPFPTAVEALRRFRQRGGRVVLVTNAPRPRIDVERQLDMIGVPKDCWDTIATSGDSARAAMFHGAVGKRVWHLGPESDLGFFEPLHIVRNAVEIERVALDEAEGVVCTGAFDAHAEPETLIPQLVAARDRGLSLLCANPDIVVDRGGVREWCAGAIAALYTRLGGSSLYFGKPHPPIYDLARQRLVEAGGAADAEALAIGDGIQTDIAGAIAEGIDALFVSGGLAAVETETPTDGQPDPDLLREHCASHGLFPRYAIGHLR